MTLVTGIFMPITFLTGWFGMNFTGPTNMDVLVQPNAYVEEKRRERKRGTTRGVCDVRCAMCGVRCAVWNCVLIQVLPLLLYLSSVH